MMAKENNIYQNFTEIELQDTVKVFARVIEAVESNVKPGARQGAVLGVLATFYKGALVEIGKRHSA